MNGLPFGKPHTVKFTFAKQQATCDCGYKSYTIFRCLFALEFNANNLFFSNNFTPNLHYIIHSLPKQKKIIISRHNYIGKWIHLFNPFLVSGKKSKKFSRSVDQLGLLQVYFFTKQITVINIVLALPLLI